MYLIVKASAERGEDCYFSFSSGNSLLHGLRSFLPCVSVSSSVVWRYGPLPLYSALRTTDEEKKKYYAATDRNPLFWGTVCVYVIFSANSKG